MESAVGLAVVVVLTSAMISAGAVLIVLALWRDRPAHPDALCDTFQDAVFLFDDDQLVDCSDRGQALLSTLTTRDTQHVPGAALAALRAHLLPSFPDFSDRLATLARDLDITLTAQDGSGLELRAQWMQGVVRLTLVDTQDRQGVIVMDRLSHRAMTQELETLRVALDHTPSIIWLTNPLGQVIWANGSYLRLLRRAQPNTTLVWPLPRIFDLDPSPEPRRIQMSTQSGQRIWFDAHNQPAQSGPNGTLLHFAQPADLAQQAEETRHQFIQLLTKTFATLPTGLAVFDRARRLQVFNPALTDLTRLEPEFLLSQPGLEGFLNRLRDKRVLPEPKDYQSWARRLLDIEKTSQGREFEETWSLGDGRTLRVSVRPQIDGALAFLIEDASQNIDLSRQARAGLESLGSVLEALPAGVAVFGADGELQMGNSRFADMTRTPADCLTGATLIDLLHDWARQGLPGDTLHAFRNVVARIDRVAEGRIHLHDIPCDIMLTLGPRGAVIVTLTQGERRAARTRQSRSQSATAPAMRLPA